jgi:hypothetical protein
MGYYKKYKFIFIRKEQGVNEVIFYRITRKIKESIKIGEKSFLIDYSSPLFVHKMVRTFIIDYDSGVQFVPGEKSSILTPGELDAILGTKIVKEIASSVAKNKMQQLIPFVIGLAIGLLAGYLICSIIMQAKIDELNAKLLEDVIVITQSISHSLMHI